MFVSIKDYRLCYKLWLATRQKVPSRRRNAAAAAENAVRAAAHLLSLAARAASGRPYLRKALVDFDPLFAPAEETPS